jgi:hypothetical protein
MVLFCPLPVVTAAATLAAGTFSTAEVSPLSWARLIADREYVTPAVP